MQGRQLSAGLLQQRLCAGLDDILDAVLKIKITIKIHDACLLAVTVLGADFSKGMKKPVVRNTPIGCHDAVVFGETVEGMDEIKKIEKVNTDRLDKPMEAVKIADCGEL